MKKKDKENIKTKDIGELKALVKEAKDALLSLRLDFSMGKIKNTRAMFEKRKEIARMLTEMRQKELLK